MFRQQFSRSSEEELSVRVGRSGGLSGGGVLSLDGHIGIRAAERNAKCLANTRGLIHFVG